MNNDLIERVLVQLQPELAQEFGYAILEDKKKLKALEIIKRKNLISGNPKIAYLPQEEYELLKEVLL